TGFLIGSLSTANEKDEFRRLFRDDQELHQRCEERIKLSTASGADGKPTCSLVAKAFMSAAIELADRIGKTPDYPSPLLFYAAPSKYQARYAEELLREGKLGRASLAWKEAQILFEELAQREMPLNDNWRGKLADLPRWRAKERGLWMQFDELCPGLRQRLFEESLRNQPTELQQAMRAEADEWAPDWEDVEQALTTKDRAALALAREAAECGQTVEDIERCRIIVNLDQWLTRCQIEQTPESLRARDLLDRARAARESGHLESDNPENPGAQQLYRSAFRSFASILREHPDCFENDLYCEDIVAEVRAARKLFGDDIIPAELARLRLRWAL
ncbi:MAG TPA: hypothetical protein VFV87_02595, partial [Pirellulaceae bacterium]|nr:hypothetical protein [Pirellulaceae bacterium]